MIPNVCTRGFGNGTFAGTVALVVTRGYAIGAAVVVTPGRVTCLAGADRAASTLAGADRASATLAGNAIDC